MQQFSVLCDVFRFYCEEMVKVKEVYKDQFVHLCSSLFSLAPLPHKMEISEIILLCKKQNQ